MRLPELSLAERARATLQVAMFGEETLAASHPSQIQFLGEMVLIDALKKRPKLEDIRTAPWSFDKTIHRLVKVASSQEVAFQIVGEAVLLARAFTGQHNSF